MLRNPHKYGGLGVSNIEKTLPLGIKCQCCQSEIQYSLTTFHKGKPEIKCNNCKLTGFMDKEKKKLVWFIEKS